MLCFSDIDAVSGWVTITMMTRNSLFALLGLDLPQVELELLALQDVAVRPAALPGPGGDGGEYTTGHELVSESLLHLGVLLPLLVLLLGVLGPLLVEDGLLGVGELCALLAAQGQREVRLVPLSEGGGVDNDDSVLDEGLGPDQLVVGGIVDDVDDPGLAGDALGAPGEVASVEPEGAVLLVAPPHPQGVDPLGRQLGHGGRSGQLELPLLPDWGPLASGSPALMPMVS